MDFLQVSVSTSLRRSLGKFQIVRVHFSFNSPQKKFEKVEQNSGLFPLSTSQSFKSFSNDSQSWSWTFNFCQIIRAFPLSKFQLRCGEVFQFQLFVAAIVWKSLKSLFVSELFVGFNFFKLHHARTFNFSERFQTVCGTVGLDLKLFKLQLCRTRKFLVSQKNV